MNAKVKRIIDAMTSEDMLPFFADRFDPEGLETKYWQMEDSPELKKWLDTMVRDIIIHTINELDIYLCVDKDISEELYLSVNYMATNQEVLNIPVQHIVLGTRIWGDKDEDRECEEYYIKQRKKIVELFTKAIMPQPKEKLKPSYRPVRKRRR